MVYEVPEEAWLKLNKAGKTTWVYVFAHCDGGCYELTIVEKEAMSQEAVVKILVAEYGVTEDRLKAYGVGPLAPVATNGTEQGRALNRRVELVGQ